MTRLLPIVLLTLTLAFLACGPVLADEIISLKAGYLMLSPEGRFAVDGNTLSGTPIDLEDDLGFDDSEDYFVEGALNLGPFRLAISYLPLEFSGSGTLSQPIVFNDQTFDVSATTSSEVKLDIIDAGLTWNIINIDDLPARIQIGPELAVKYVDVDLSMTGVEASSGLSISETDSAQVPIPTIGARARISFSDFIGLVGRIGYMEYQDNSFLDAEAQIEFSPIPLVGIFGGYRYFDLQIDDSDIYVDAQFSGPFAGALVRF
jgi:outer membrane protein